MKQNGMLVVVVLLLQWVAVGNGHGVTDAFGGKWDLWGAECELFNRLSLDLGDAKGCALLDAV